VDDFKEGETLAFSNHEDFRRFAVAKLTKIESDGRFSSDKGYIYPFAKRIEYKLL
jgi:hypothetical protein